MTAETVQHQPCEIDELRTLFLFEKLDDDQLRWLCERGGVELWPPGLVFREGDPATCFFVILEGTIAMTKRYGNDDSEIGRSSYRGAYTGAIRAYLEDGYGDVYRQSVRAIEPTRFFVLPAEDFAYMVKQWFPTALHLIEGLIAGSQRNEQRVRLEALGSLSAGLTHELNNPASAAVRATSSLRQRVAGMRHKLAMIASGVWDGKQMSTLVELQERATEMVAKAPELSPMESADREDAISDWFDEQGIKDGYDLAPTFVAAGIDVPWLEQVSATVGDGVLEGAIRWLSYTLETELLMNEIEDSTTRISHLVDAAKQYSQMDRAPYQVLDIHELIGSTLVMLNRKIGKVRVVKEFDRSIPKIPVFGAELNQVWTNLIDNALQAMDDDGTLTIRTGMEDGRVRVDIEDTGPGIDADNLDRIFQPFFTTKPVGKGTGLGLDISRQIVVKKHHGDITVDSNDQRTVFSVFLPVTAQAGPSDD